MEQVSQEAVLDNIVAREPWSIEDQDEFVRKLSTVDKPPVQLRKILSELEAANPDPSGVTALKIGIFRHMLCRHEDALQVFAKATDNKERRYFQACCYLQLRQYDKAAEEFARAKDRGWDALAIDLKLVEVMALAGQVDEAAKALAKLESKAGQAADYQYLRGLLCELNGEYEQAAEAYQKAREIQPGHGPATFRLAYCYDLHGSEEEAIELYKECTSRPPIYLNALLNLAVLYEDAGENDMAIAYLKQVLAINPGHARARLFIKDVLAAKNMYFDEDQAKIIARRNAVLDIPVTDFELSVRARNCLKKMNIRTLGDLVRTSEATLLAYKNFGETSLKEIKDMLSLKGLRLGQALEEDAGFEAEDIDDVMSGKDQGVLGTQLSQLEFSVRARKALEGLGIHTLGDLVSKSEPELLACKNFGQTSLNEIQQRLTEYGLKLREAN